MRSLKPVSIAVMLVMAFTPAAQSRSRQVESFIRHVDMSVNGKGRVDEVEGVVEARTDRCVEDRHVAVYVDPNGKSRLFGEGATDDDGSFEIHGEDASGLDYAIAVFRVRRGGLRCLGKAVVRHAVAG